MLGCYGVVGMSAKTLRDGLAVLLQQENPYRGVEVQFVDRYKIIIDLYVIVEYGAPHQRGGPEHHGERQVLRGKGPGLPVVQVNVHVQGLHVSNAD